MLGVCMREVRFGYTDRKILDSISFRAEQGKLLCVLGRNGVGKTTLFQLLLGSLKGYEGRIEVNGKSLEEYEEKELAKQIAYIPQSYHPAYNYTVQDMVLMGVTPSLGMFEMPGKKHVQRVEQALESVGLLHLRHQNFCHISSGEKQMALIARAIAQNTRILVMDEPSSNLDFGNGVRVMKLCQKLAHQGYLIIQSTHNPQHVFSYADEVLVLEDGKISVQGDPAKCLDEEILSRIYQIPTRLFCCSEFQQKICVAL